MAGFTAEEGGEEVLLSTALETLAQGVTARKALSL